MNVRRRSPRFTNTGEASASTLNSNELEVIQPAVTRSLAAPRPLFDTQANESRAVLRSALTSLGGAISVDSLKPYVIIAARSNTQSRLDIRMVQATIQYTPSSNYHPTVTVNASATSDSPISNLKDAFPVNKAGAVHFKFGHYQNPSWVVIKFQARHTQYFTQGQYEVYLLIDGEARTLVATIDSHPGHSYVSGVWSTFSVTLPRPVTNYYRQTFTLEFVRTL